MERGVSESGRKHARDGVFSDEAYEDYAEHAGPKDFSHGPCVNAAEEDAQDRHADLGHRAERRDVAEQEEQRKDDYGMYYLIFSGTRGAEIFTHINTPFLNHFSDAGPSAVTRHRDASDI